MKNFNPANLRPMPSGHRVKKYQQYANRLVVIVRVTKKTQMIYLTEADAETLKHTREVSFYYDGEGHLAIKPDPRGVNAYHMSKYGGSDLYYISCKSILDALDFTTKIHDDYALVYEAHAVDGMLVVDLKSAASRI